MYFSYIREKFTACVGMWESWLQRSWTLLEVETWSNLLLMKGMMWGNECDSILKTSQKMSALIQVGCEEGSSRTWLIGILIFFKTWTHHTWPGIGVAAWWQNKQKCHSKFGEFQAHWCADRNSWIINSE